MEFPGKTSLALLLDPDKTHDDELENILGLAERHRVDYIMTGGSITFRSIDKLINSIKEKCSIPVVLFPGNLLQLSSNADRILLLSLISGRNPELLIGNHVIAAPYLRTQKEKLVSTGYILIGCGSKTSVEYISQTEAIPFNKPDIAVATAMAGEMLGLRMIYLEAGSGARTTVPVPLIRAVRENISVPLAVGGGIRSGREITDIYRSGADLIVLGNGCEKDPDLLAEACAARDKARKLPE
ncbi:MAG TPA: geranylgeranylglyceryl/heptaprenylglyceryl phosphate synthase [Bacteroidales bacterium]|jgi:putative glycerol-1-phosphate prenyltransferase|nr:geranylgeranylglyceryl/heptaprenylglyceryl phosphate synthase [Bacteroidales bacterium]HQJ81673.1 geranylgeranylglyceryl/heptaprenylglyceryl phosphate synthase [Bacteroidales bacterium]